MRFGSRPAEQDLGCKWPKWASFATLREGEEFRHCGGGELRGESLLLCVERNLLRWFERLIWRFSTVSGRRRQTQTRCVSWLLMPWSPPRRSWGVSLMRRMSGFLSGTCCFYIGGRNGRTYTCEENTEDS